MSHLCYCLNNIQKNHRDRTRGGKTFFFLYGHVRSIYQPLTQCSGGLSVVGRISTVIYSAVCGRHCARKSASTIFPDRILSGGSRSDPVAGRTSRDICRDYLRVVLLHPCFSLFVRSHTEATNSSPLLQTQQMRLVKLWQTKHDLVLQNEDKRTLLYLRCYKIEYFTLFAQLICFVCSTIDCL